LFNIKIIHEVLVELLAVLRMLCAGNAVAVVGAVERSGNFGDVEVVGRFAVVQNPDVDQTEEQVGTTKENKRLKHS
jgi:hypothetical protein